MAVVSEQEIFAALRKVTAPGQSRDVVAHGWITNLQVKQGHVGFTLAAPPLADIDVDSLRRRCEQAVFDLPGVLSATAVLGGDRSAPAKGASPEKGGAGGSPPEKGGAAPDRPSEPAPQRVATARTAAQAQHAAKQGVPGVRAIIAVASGKGGVGKSTTAVNLALGLKGLGLRVGLMDADVYGPSVPRMMGLSGKPDSKDGRTIEPKEAFGIKCMSIGLMVPQETAVIWRGPMVMSAIEQLIRDVSWAPLDVLVCDLPPGTGDAQLTMAQRVPLTGAVVVSTPQEVALGDVRKGIDMFRKVEVPVFGVIENMSFYVCPSCGHRAELFGHGGARQTAAELDCDFLGEIPLHLAIREHADLGQPIVVAQPDGEHARAYRALAEKVRAKIDAAMSVKARSQPRIVME
jgi:ATP-binding protein involved in chromosome partitioning